ncbi:MAG: metal ABC transporter permease [Anaerolineales bacterium]|nr:metal ABC transporter permease [Anaerolineales bacterium]
MNILDLLASLLFDHTIRTVALGTATLGVVSGVLGSFAVLRKQSLLGDALSHAALPGVALAYMLTGSKSSLVLMLGAGVAGVLAILLLVGITTRTRLKEDSVLGIVLSVFFGLGLMLLTFLQRNPDARQAGLNTFLFGQAATLLTRDVLTMAVFGGLALLLALAFWKEFKLLSFDRDFGASLGLPMGAMDILLTTLLVVAVVIGLQAVGVVLMSAMLVAPGAAARQWTDNLGRMTLLSALFGAVAGVAGALVSSLGSGLSTGPVIVLCISLIVLISLTLAPNRGLLWNSLRQWRTRRRLRSDVVLENLYQMSSQHADPTHPHAVAALEAVSGSGAVRRSLQELQHRGLATPHPNGQWALTPQGVALAQRQQQAAKPAEERRHD